MCHIEDVFHACRHWGRTQLVGDPCVRARFQNGRYAGCNNNYLLGMTNSADQCPECKVYGSQGQTWRPFQDILQAGASHAPPIGLQAGGERQRSRINVMNRQAEAHSQSEDAQTSPRNGRRPRN